MRNLVLPLLILALAGCESLVAAVARPDVTTARVDVEGGEFALDPTHAAVLFRINHLGFADYIGRFEVLDASLDFDPDNPEASSLSATVDIASLDIANEEFAETLTGPDWFDAENHPQAVFRSTAIEVTGEATGRVTGELTLKGTTAPITLDVTFNGGGDDRLRSAYVVGFSATGSFDRTAFGINRFSGLITDMVRIEIEAEFLRR